MPKVEGVLGTPEAVWGGFWVKTGHIPTPGNSQRIISQQAAPAVPAYLLHSPCIWTDDLKARRERIQGEDLVP